MNQQIEICLACFVLTLAFGFDFSRRISNSIAKTLFDIVVIGGLSWMIVKDFMAFGAFRWGILCGILGYVLSCILTKGRKYP